MRMSAMRTSIGLLDLSRIAGRRVAPVRIDHPECRGHSRVEEAQAFATHELGELRRLLGGHDELDLDRETRQLDELRLVQMMVTPEVRHRLECGAAADPHG